MINVTKVITEKDIALAIDEGDLSMVQVLAHTERVCHVSEHDTERALLASLGALEAHKALILETLEKRRKVPQRVA